jgi:uncharacterized protein (DUF433 family)
MIERPLRIVKTVLSRYDRRRRRSTRTMKKSAGRSRITVDAGVCGGRPCIRDTRIEIAVVLDGLAEGLTIEGIIDHYPQLTREDILAALAYAAELAHESVWKVAVNT